MTTSTVPSAQPCDDLRLLRGRHEAREPADFDREPPEAPGEGPKVLLGQDRRRREQSHLLAVHDRLEGGPHRDLRLAVTDIAHQQTVHRPRGFHVALGFGDGLRLVGGRLVLERLFELALPRRVLGEREPCRQLALRLDLQELLGQVLEGTLDPGLGTRPGAPAQAVEAGRGALGGCVLLQHVSALERYQQLPAAGVLELHALVLLAVESERAKAGKAADAVVRVHDEVAGLKVAHLREHAGERPALSGGRWKGRQVRAPEHHETSLAEGEAALQPSRNHADDPF